MFVVLALLLALLRLAEFAGHRLRHPTPHVNPAVIIFAAQTRGFVHSFHAVTVACFGGHDEMPASGYGA